MRFQEAGWTMLTAFFSKLQQETLKEQGFCSTEVTGNAAKATLKGILYAAPFFIFLTGIYHIFLSHRATMPDMAGARMFLIPAAVWAISTLLHQALHGIGLAILGKAGWDSISFHKNGRISSCSCCLALARDPYLAGILLPAAVSGISSILFLVIFPGTCSLLAMAVNFTLAGTDLATAADILKGSYLFLAGHPTKTGFIGYAAEPKAPH